MSFPYKKVLVVGGTSGIGKALAERMIQNGIQVVVVGRRKENLDAFVQQHGEDKASSYVFDITKLDQIKSFAADITKSHPDIDSVFLNSGVQRPFDFSKPESIDLATFDMELTTNYTSFIHLIAAFLPHLQKSQNQTSIIMTTSGLAVVPITRCPGYCATKAALHSFIITLREQVKNGSGNIKVIELAPPAVQTELHDEKHQPDIKNGASFGMPIDEFTNEAWEGLNSGKEEIAVGFAKNSYDAIEPKRQEIFQRILKMTQSQREEHVKRGD